MSSALTARTAASLPGSASAPRAEEDEGDARGQVPPWWRRWTVWLVGCAAIALAVAIVGLAWPHLLGLGPKSVPPPRRAPSRAGAAPTPTPVPPAADLPQGDPWAPNRSAPAPLTSDPSANGAGPVAPSTDAPDAPNAPAGLANPDNPDNPDTPAGTDLFDLNADATPITRNRAPSRAGAPTPSDGFAKRVCERIAACSGNANLVAVCEWAQQFETLHDDTRRNAPLPGTAPVAARCLAAIATVDCQLRPALVIDQLLQSGCLEWLMEEP